ncbi:MAG: hypothetical protein WCS03_01355 [Bacteroidota bacterium]
MAKEDLFGRDIKLTGLQFKLLSDESDKQIEYCQNNHIMTLLGYMLSSGIKKKLMRI